MPTERAVPCARACNSSERREGTRRAAAGDERRLARRAQQKVVGAPHRGAALLGSAVGDEVTVHRGQRQVEWEVVRSKGDSVIEGFVELELCSVACGARRGKRIFDSVSMRCDIAVQDFYSFL